MKQNSAFLIAYTYITNIKWTLFSQWKIMPKLCWSIWKYKMLDIRRLEIYFFSFQKHGFFWKQNRGDKVIRAKWKWKHQSIVCKSTSLKSKRIWKLKLLFITLSTWPKIIHSLSDRTSKQDGWRKKEWEKAQVSSIIKHSHERLTQNRDDR